MKVVLVKMSDGWLSSYGGIFEKGVNEYTLDDFYALQLDKLDLFTCLKPSNVVIDENADDESSDDDDEFIDYSNGWFLTGISYAIWVVVVVANGYLLVTLAIG